MRRPNGPRCVPDPTATPRNTNPKPTPAGLHREPGYVSPLAEYQRYARLGYLRSDLRHGIITRHAAPGPEVRMATSDGPQNTAELRDRRATPVRAGTRSPPMKWVAMSSGCISHPRTHRLPGIDLPPTVRTRRSLGRHGSKRLDLHALRTHSSQHPCIPTASLPPQCPGISRGNPR